MDANKIKLLEFIGTSKRTFNIPVYQRNYDWKSEHCKRLFADLERIIASNNEIKHFLGTIVYVQGYARPDFGEYIIIDGQQRITSIMLLLKALHDDINADNLREEIKESYLINKHERDEKFRIKLKSIESDMSVYEKIISDDFSGISSSNNIARNYTLFKKLLEESKYTPEEIYQAMNHVEIVYISLEKDKKSENPQLIFESLNSTGLALLPADLIRNFLLMNHSYDEQKRLYEKYWMKIEGLLPNVFISDFVRDYLTMKYGSIPSKEKLYNTFKEYVITNKEFDEEGILSDLSLYANYYSWFINYNSADEEINELLDQLDGLKSKVVRPVLLYIFRDCFEYKKINCRELKEILEMIVAYLVRRAVCDFPTNPLNILFASLIKELEKMKSDSNSYYDSFCKSLVSKSGKSVFLQDDQFKEAFIKKDLYNTKICQHILFKLENYGSKEHVSCEKNITIEHVMPQKLTPNWRIELGNKYEEIHRIFLHTVGNLTLTGLVVLVKCIKNDQKQLEFINFNHLIVGVLNLCLVILNKNCNFVYLLQLFMLYLINFERFLLKKG